MHCLKIHFDNRKNTTSLCSNMRNSHGENGSCFSD